jgi:hypothetical protein
MKTYLTVPFSAAHRARSLGAQWDMSRKSWFVPDGGDLGAFTEWLPRELRGWFGNLRTRPTASKASRNPSAAGRT